MAQVSKVMASREAARPKKDLALLNRRRFASGLTGVKFKATRLAEAIVCDLDQPLMLRAASMAN